LTIILDTQLRVVRKCLASIKDYWPREWLIVVVDYGLSPENGRVLTEISKGIKKIFGLDAPEVNLTRQTAADAVKSVWIAFLDEDAVADLNWLRVLIETVRVSSGERVGAADPGECMVKMCMRYFDCASFSSGA